jgi:transcription antitermination factor NusG
MTSFHWYIVYTKPRCELKVANLLTRKQIKNYCPLHPVENQLLDSKKLIFEPLFRSYVFVYITRQYLPVVLDIPGVINYLYWLDKPATINENEVNSLVKLLKDNKNCKVEKCVIPKNNRPGHERFEYLNMETQTRENHLEVSLPSLGFCVIASPAITL